MRKNLYMFRHKLKLSQQAMADKIGCSRITYAAIEAGKRDGRVKFWTNIKNAFGLTAQQRDELITKEN